MSKGFANPQQTWDKRFEAEGYIFGTAPNVWLAGHAGLLAPGMRVLAVADGSQTKNEKGPIPDKPEPILTILKPLIFGQYDSYGVDIKPSIETGGAAGVDFSLGYSGKNFAVMPLFAEERGRYKELGGEGGRYNKEAYSVLGQFKADQATTSPDLKLERFFATGLAAQYLSRGLQARISADLRSEAARNSEVTGK